MIKVKNYSEAWEIVNEIFPTDYDKDEESSQRAGYPIYRSTAEGRYYDYICDLNDRLEVNLKDENRTINVWIEAEPELVQEEKESPNAEERGKVLKRIHRLTAWFAEEMIDQEEHGRKAKEEFEKACAEDPGKHIVLVDCSSGNAECMKNCMKASIKAAKYIRDKENDVEDWQITGINAMFDKVNESKTIPFDLPYAINGILLILEEDK